MTTVRARRLLTLAAALLGCVACAAQGAQPGAREPEIDTAIVIGQTEPEPAPVEESPADPGPSEPEDVRGLHIEDLSVGSGAAVKSGDMVTVHYVGTLLNGTVFDSSRERGTPFKITLGKNRVIQGWELGLLGMRPGGTRRLTIPPEMAYGEKGHPPKIPPASTLVFEIELLAVE